MLTLDSLDRMITIWADKTYIGVYALRNDGGFIKLLVMEESKESITEYLKDEYPEYFEEGN